MKRYCGWLAVGLTVLAIGSLAWGQADPKPVEVQGQGGQARGGWAQQDYLYLPGYWQLSQENVRQEIEIVPEQLEKLKKISKEFMEEQRNMYSSLQPKPDQPMKTPEEYREAYAEIQKKWGELNEKFTGQVKDVLLPHQIKALEDIDFRNKAGMMLQYPYYVDRLNLTDEQKEQVKKNRDALAKKIQKAQQEALDEVLELLTPEQIDVLKAPWPAQGVQVKAEREK